MPSQKLIGDLQLIGKFMPTSMSYPSEEIDDAAVAPDADISADKLVHRHQITERQATGTAIVAKTEDVYTALASGAVNAVNVVATTAPTGGTEAFTVDVQKGNQSTVFATILTGVVTYDTTKASRQVVEGAMSGTVSYAAGDTFRVIVAVSGSGGSQGQGLVVTLTLDEQPS